MAEFVFKKKKKETEIDSHEKTLLCGDLLINSRKNYNKREQIKGNKRR